MRRDKKSERSESGRGDRRLGGKERYRGNEEKLGDKLVVLGQAQALQRGEEETWKSSHSHPLISRHVICA
ncbi:hypothetical protein TorRG33x02_112130 [Trema orientale]|uniref:Uncharacterized protein n=1 Tax=Trema orientale TaxID=63057 RepID=A0A2P5F579_TREOI|nr:hypothetical protein TorRG33x02_112130 [Trema orientale]